MTLLHGKVHDESAALLGGISGHAGLFSSANDLAKLMQLYLNRGQYGGDTLIAAHAVDTFTRAHFAELGNHRGLGFDKLPLNYSESTLPSKAAGPASFGHSGYTGTFTWADPDTGLLLVFLSNRVHPTRNNSLISTLRIRTRIHDAAYQSIQDGAAGE
jgi:CubicO group peptidase (beta-lactamase class C family)